MDDGLGEEGFDRRQVLEVDAETRLVRLAVGVRHETLGVLESGVEGASVGEGLLVSGGNIGDARVLNLGLAPHEGPDEGADVVGALLLQLEREQLDAAVFGFAQGHHNESSNT